MTKVFDALFEQVKTLEDEEKILDLLMRAVPAGEVCCHMFIYIHISI